MFHSSEIFFYKNNASGLQRSEETLFTQQKGRDSRIISTQAEVIILNLFDYCTLLVYFLGYFYQQRIGLGLLVKIRTPLLSSEVQVIC